MTALGSAWRSGSPLVATLTFVKSARPRRAPAMAMRIVRHSKIALTMEIYTEAPSDATRDALRKLSDWLA